MTFNCSILSTRPVSKTLVAEAAEMGIQLNAIAFIDTEPIQDIDVQQEVEQTALQYATVVFTSMNAVESVITMLDEQVPEWSIYCMGNTTAELITNYFGENAIAGTASSAADLADLIIENEDTDEVVFFCGDQRRDELPEKLAKAGIDLNEVVVYKTIPLPKKLETNYEGVIFFSPSAVHSYFSVNKVDDQTILFAIGQTTATAIKQYTNNKLIIANSPGKEELVRKAIKHFGGV